MSIGYACIQIGSEKTNLSSIRLKNATSDNIRLVIQNNLSALVKTLKYNIKNDIKLFRISSDIIPFGSHPVNKIKWWDEFNDDFKYIGRLIKDSQMRVSMHPGQYTVLNSLNSDVANKAVIDLEYHCRFLDSLGCDDSCKIILHIGGVYSDKQASINRFITKYNELNEHVKKRLVIENDDKSYTIQDVLSISRRTGIPVVFDNLHHSLNSKYESLSTYDWIDKCKKTWKSKDGKQKIHYSQQNIVGNQGAHSKSINSSSFIDFYNNLTSKNIDIMLEVKDKNLSAKKCILLTNENISILSLEKEWARYKYLVLCHSAKIYNDIRNLLKDKKHPNVIQFYKLIELAEACDEDIGAEINAAQHIWGYLNDNASKKDHTRFQKLIQQYSKGTISIISIKKFLFKLAQIQSINYLLDSLYFYV